MVLNIYSGNEWQFMAKDGSGLLPWYTRPMLDILESMDLSDKNIFEFGGGTSSVFYARHAKFLYTIESNEEWVYNIRETLEHYKLGRNIIRYESDPNKYCEALSKVGLNYHIIIVDGIERDRCTMNALRHAREGSIIILDNFLQPSVEVASEEVQEEVKKYKHELFFQEGHPDWCTCAVYK